MLLLCMVGIAALAGGTLALRKAGSEDRMVREPEESNIVQRQRLLRSEIPTLNVRTMVYRTLFNDGNDVQLEAAVRNGVRDFAAIEDPTCCPELVRVESTALYVVDTMQYSVPYLVPEAHLLLQRIAERFQEVMQECYPDNLHTYRLVVTSCFRTPDHVRRLMRRNRNASENSCHRYGTTMDISHIRWINEQNDTVNELYLKQMLAKTLYELRYEGLCWVKYERRQACFHLTLRHTEYQGNLPQITEYRDRSSFANVPSSTESMLPPTEQVAETTPVPPSEETVPIQEAVPRQVSSPPREVTQQPDKGNYLEYM